MSKLFDQLKNAARTREEKSPGLLLEALQKSQHAIVAPAEGGSVPTAQAGAQSPVARDPAAAPAKAGAQITRFAGIALAALIFAVVVLAWHSAPWRAPQKLRIDPTELKLDRTLDVDRTSPKGTSPPGRPS